MSETRGLTLDPSCPVDWAHPLNAGLVGDWTPAPLPGWSGGLTLRDLVRGGRRPNDGTLTNGPTWVGGPHDGFRALNFDGVDDYVDIADDPVWDANYITLSCWFRTTATATRALLDRDDEGSSRCWQFRCNSPRIEFIPFVGGSPLFANGTSNPIDGRWHHAAATYDGATARVYVDGLPEGSAAGAGVISPGTIGPRFGRRRQGDSQFGGAIADWRFYSRALSAAQVAALHDQRRRGSPDLYRWLRPWSFGVTVAGAAPPNSGSGESVGIGVATGAGVTARSGSGSAIGVGAATGGGATARSGSGESAGIGIATGAGSATHSGAGESVGLGAATGAGLATHSGSGATVGVGVATGTGVATHSGSGESAGTGAATGAGIAAHSGSGDAIGVGSATGAGAATHSGSGASIGVGVATGEGDAPGAAAAGSGESVGVGVATGAGYAVRGGSGEATGVGAATGAGATARSGSGESVGIGVATGAGDDGDSAASVFGGAFRRAPATWPRALARRRETWGRACNRSLPTLARVWRYNPMALPTESGVALIAAVSDDRDYAFDCSAAPELAGGTGVTISSGEILGGDGLTFGSVAVLAAAFDGIPAGKGLSVRISGGDAGVTYKLACRVTLSSGRKVVVPGRLAKVADYDA